MKGITIDFEGLDEKQVNAIMLALKDVKGLPEPTRWTGEVTRTKPLPRDENGAIKNHFVANGIHYNIVSDGIGIKRWTEYEKMLVSVTYGRTFQQIWDIMNEGRKVCNAATDLDECKLAVNDHFKSFQDSLIDFGQEKHALVFQCATLFIVRDGTDLSIYDKTIAEQDVENWTKEGYKEEDFFLLCIAADKDYLNVLEKRNTALAAKARQLENVTTTDTITEGKK